MTIESEAGNSDRAASPASAPDWLERQVTGLRDQMDRLRREVDVLGSTLHEQQRTVMGLQNSADVLEESTRRYETEQQTTRTTQQRAGSATEAMEAALARLTERVRGVEQQDWSGIPARSGGAGADADDALPAASRIEALESRVTALAEAAMYGREAHHRLDATLPDIGAALNQLEARTETMRNELRRTTDEVAQERARRDREDELLELIDQQRATRVRVEERLALYGEQLDEARQRLGAAGEERGALARQIARTDERLLALSSALDMQRAAIVEHFQRLVEAERAASSKQVEGIETRLREGQRLLTQLREGSEQSAPDPTL